MSQTTINFLTMVGTVGAAVAAFFSVILSIKALGDQNPLISFYVGAVGRDIDSNNYRIDVVVENTGNSPASMMVIEAVSNDITKANIGIPTIINSKSRSNISIWLKEKNKDVKVAVSLYYWNIRENKCFRTIGYMKLKHTENGADVYRMVYQRIDRIYKYFVFRVFRKRVYKKIPEAIMQWDGDRKQNGNYFTRDWLQDARNFYTTE